MTRVLVLDLETRSVAKLGRGGTNAYCYARHPHTDIWMACYVFTDAPDDVRTWWPGEPMPSEVRAHVEAGGVVCCHNFSFEHAIWTEILTPRYEWAPLSLEQGTDTAARAARCGLPRSLERAAPAAGLVVAKDKAGAAQMKRMAKPRSFAPDGTPIWWDVPERVERLHAYCKQDVRVQLKLHQVLPELPARERDIWLATMRANVRGMMLDLPFIREAIRLVDQQLGAYARELLTLTNGQVKSHSDLNGMKAFLAHRGVPVDSLDKQVVAALRKDESLPADVRRVVSIRAEAGKSSVAKYPAMLAHADADGIARDQLVYYGATSTGRWSGMGIQVQNLPARGDVSYQDAEWWIDALRFIQQAGVADLMEALHEGSPIETLSMCLRGAITARPGKIIICADYANIEGRFGAWLAGEDWKVQAFRDFDAGQGFDIYRLTAAMILGKHPDDVTKEERAILGKTPELALLFGGGAGAFASMGENFGIDMGDYYATVRAVLDPEIFARAEENHDMFGKRSPLPRQAWLVSEAIKLAWRDRHPATVDAWRDTEGAAVAAILHQGEAFSAMEGRLAFLCRDMFGKRMLLMRLPSGRCIHYANVSLREQKTPWGAVKQQIWFDKVEGGRIIRSGTFGGDIFQSATQGGARDIMAQGWLNVADASYDPLFSVHDELAAEADPQCADLPQFESLLCQRDEWAATCPVTAKGYVAPRFRKD